LEKKKITRAYYTVSRAENVLGISLDRIDEK
jgi:hypothetical protein